MLSETSFSPVISASIRSSMALRFSARRSSSSPLRPTGPTAGGADGGGVGETASKDARGGAGNGTDPLQPPPRNEDAAADAEHNHHQDRPLRGFRDDAEQPPPLLQIAPDQEPEIAAE